MSRHSRPEKTVDLIDGLKVFDIYWNPKQCLVTFSRLIYFDISILRDNVFGVLKLCC
jgi:hypothetical protein